MFFLPNDDMFPNKFVETMVPTKAQIFARTGQRAVSPAGQYTGDDEVKRYSTPTESADEFARAAEGFKSETPKEDLPD